MTDQFPFPNPLVPGHLWNKENEFKIPVVSTVGVGPKGAKGDTGDAFTFDDFTQEELDEITRGITAVGNKVISANYVTTGITTTITIPIPDFDQFDMLFVDVNGLDLMEGEDYVISGNTITLAHPITKAGQEVHFKAMRYQVADGDKIIHNEIERITEDEIDEICD